MMLDALGVGLGGFSRNAYRPQNVDHQPMAGAHSLSQRGAGSQRTIERIS